MKRLLTVPANGILPTGIAFSVSAGPIQVGGTSMFFSPIQVGGTYTTCSPIQVGGT